MEQKTTKTPPVHTCSFCFKTQREVEVLIKAPLGDVGICNECHVLCGDIIEAHRRENIKMLPRNENPQFCIITPTAYCQRYASQSTMHLVLAHLVASDSEYAQFYAHRNEFKIMDNGAFELGYSYAPDKLLSLGTKCKADAIVLPDYPFQPAQKTIDESMAVIDEIRDAGFKTMFVPQSETGDVEDWINCYRWASENDAIDIIGMSILGMPNAIPHIPTAYARVVLTQILIERGLFNFNKYHHYLGLNAGPALEIPPLIEMNAMDSMDSSGPVWAGICGTMYSKMCDSYQPVRKISKHVDFAYPLVRDDWVHDAIQYNIDLTQSLLP